MNGKTACWYLLALCLTVANAWAKTDQELLQDAQNHTDRNEFKAAIIELKNLLKQSPDHAEGRLRLGELYLKQGDTKGALKELEKARDLKSDPKQWTIPLAQAYLLNREPKKILDEFAVDGNWEPDLQAKLTALHGLAYLMTEQKDAALKAFQDALQLDPHTNEALLGLARIAINEKRFDDAKNYARQALDNDTQDINAWLSLGESERLKKNNQAAIEAYNSALNLQKNNIQAMLGRAMSYLAQNDSQSAATDVAKVRKLVGDLPFALYLQGLIAFQSKQYQDAENILHKVENVMPKHGPTQLLLGIVSYALQKFESAESYLSAYVKENPQQASAIKVLAATRIKLGHPANAIELIESSGFAQSDDPQLLALLGSAYLQTKDYDKGTAILGRAAELAPNTAAIHAQLALGQIATGNLDHAVDELESAVAMEKGLIQADVLLVLTFIQQKNYQAAIDSALKLSKKMPDNPMPNNLIAASYLAQGDFDNAKKYWLEALRIKPDYASAILNLARLESKQGHYNAAAERYQSLLKYDAKHINAMIGLAQLAELQKDYPTMAEWLEKAHHADSQALQPTLMLSKYYRLSGKALQALDLAREAYSVQPENPTVLQNLGLAQLFTDNSVSAIGTLRKLVNLNPKMAQAHHYLAQALYKNGDKNQALEEWNQALSIAPDFLPAAVARAQFALAAKQYDKVSEYARELRESHPESYQAYRLEGDNEFAQKHYQQAKQAYQAAYKISQTSSLVQRLFQIHQALGETQEAISVLQEWLKISPKDTNSWLTLAMTYQQQQQQKQAIDAYEKVAELLPSNYVALNNLAWLYQQRGDDKALDFARRALQLAAENPEVMDTAGWIYFHQGQTKKGLDLLHQAAVLAPHMPIIRIHLAEALIKDGQKEEARKELTRLLRDKNRFAERETAESLLNSL